MALLPLRPDDHVITNSNDPLQARTRPVWAVLRAILLSSSHGRLADNMAQPESLAE